MRLIDVYDLRKPVLRATGRVDGDCCNTARFHPYAHSRHVVVGLVGSHNHRGMQHIAVTPFSSTVWY